MSAEKNDLPNHSLETLLTFPARFPIKVMGKNNPDFRAVVLQVAREKIPTADLIAINENQSKNQKFLSLTIVANFHDKSSIDEVYKALSSNPHVIMAL